MSIDVAIPTRMDTDQRTARWDRLTPLSGLAFLVLLAVSAASGGSPPTDYAPGSEVLTFFGGHEGATKVSTLLAALAVVFLILFASRLRSWLQDAGADVLANAVFGGAVVVAVGGAARAGIGWALAAGHADIDPGTAQSLNVLFSTHYPAIVGIATLMLAAWGSILSTRALPTWLGWAALPIALVALVPTTIVSLIASAVWMAVAGVVMFQREGQRTPRP